MSWIVIELHGGPQYAAICTDAEGNNKVFDSYDEAEAEAKDCQDGKVVEVC
jgi:hypothetical protein